MENIQHKLQEYRERKRRRDRLQRYSWKVRDFLMLGVRANNQEDQEWPTHTFDLPEAPIKLCSSDDDEESVCSGVVDHSSSGNTALQYALWIVYFALWTTLFIIAIELQFGVVYLTLSALVAIYVNTRTGPKKGNEISAYSVFNKDCRSIDGTLKAEQFEREIGIR